MNRPLTVAEVATRLGIGSDLVARYCAQGRLRAEKPGRDWLVDPASVERFEQERRGRGRPPKSQPPAASASEE